MQAAFTKFAENLKHPWFWVVLNFLISPFMPEYIAPCFTIICLVIVIADFIKRRASFQPDLLSVLLFLYIAYMFIGITYSKTPLYSFWISLYWLCMFFGYISTVRYIDTSAKLEAVIKAIVVSASVLGFLAVLQYLFYSFSVPFPNPLWSFLDQAVLKFLPLPTNVEFIPGRAHATFMNSNVFGTFMIMVFPFVTHFCTNAKTVFWKIYSYLSALLLLCGIGVTFSRGCYLAMLASLALIFIASKKRLFFLGSILVAAFFFIPHSVFDRFFTLGILDNSMNIRLCIWKNSLKIFKENPVFGLGPGVQNVWDILQNRFFIQEPHAHNVGIEILLEGGIIALAIALAILGVFLYRMIRSALSSPLHRNLFFHFCIFIIAFIAEGMSDHVLLAPKIIQYFLMLLGLGIAAGRVYASMPASVSTPSSCEKDQTLLPSDTPKTM